MRLPARSLTAIAALTLGLTALAGCSGGSTTPTASEPAAQTDQTVPEACEVVAGGLQELEAAMTDVSEDVQAGDLTAVGEVMQSMEDKLSALLPDVTNAEVSAVVTDMTSALGQFNESLSGAENIEDLAGDEAFAEAGVSMQEAGTAFTELCGP